ncbi:MAG: DUF4349 domain-containing protein, partial [Lachnospiraceae bacterium]|nr:DUF4349 domain-containing protein [Lachnospiraceae bacterium]
LCLTACGGAQNAYTEAVTEDAAADAGMYASSASYQDVVTEKAAAAAGNTSSVADFSAAEEYAVAEASAEEPFYGETDGGELSGATGAAANVAETDISKKLIKNVDLDVETRQFDELIETINAEVERLGGYVENFNVSGYAGESARYGNMTARVPSEHLDGFIHQVGEQSNITYRNESVQDVTLTYVDLEAHKKSLLAERERLMELLGQAETVTDLIEIEGRLSEVRYQIESMESQLRAIDNQVSYSTVYISISEVEVFTPPAEVSAWDEIVTGLKNNVQRVLDGLEDMGIELIISLPFLIVWAVGIFIFVLLIRLIRKLLKKRKEKRRQKKQARGSIEADYEEIPPAAPGKQEAAQQGEQKEKE